MFRFRSTIELLREVEPERIMCSVGLGEVRRYALVSLTEGSSLGSVFLQALSLHR